jgi:predicted ester cyclase
VAQTVLGGLATASEQQFPYLRIPATFFEYWTTLAEGAMVVTRWTARSTQGELKGDAPTGNEVSVTGITITRISGGKVEEEWLEYDTLHLMQQIGATQSP